MQEFAAELFVRRGLNGLRERLGDGVPFLLGAGPPRVRR